MPTQSLIVHIDSVLARRVRTFLTDSDGGYASLSEFAEVALLNQLDLEHNRKAPGKESGPASTGSMSTSGRGSSSLLSQPSETGATLAEPAPGGEALFVLTNRLGPVKVATRVLANLAWDGHWPQAKEFQQAAAAEARELGLRLREEDRHQGIRGGKRRSIGFPVGKDEQAALDRFIFSFTASVRDGRSVGPLAVLGLVNCLGESVALTEAGWALATEASPLLEGNGVGTLSQGEAAILRERIRGAPEELEAVGEFFSVVRRSAGRQARVDELLAAAHSDWSADLTIAHRSAMLGRLGDVGAVSVVGRGGDAMITLEHPADEFGEASVEEAS